MDVLQTIGICVGSIALVAIAVMMFLMMMMLTAPQEEDHGSIVEYMASLSDEPRPRGRPKK